jgi:hypothetical protein
MIFALYMRRQSTWMGTGRATGICVPAFVSAVWIVFYAVLAAVNWATIGQDVRAHPREWVALLVACMLMQLPLIWYGAACLRRRKLAELNEVKTILEKMDEEENTAAQ